MRLSVVRWFVILAATQFLPACVNPVEIVYSDDKKNIDRTLGASLSLIDPNSSGQLDHIKDAQFKLLAPQTFSNSKKMYSYACAATFTADADIHIRYCKRTAAKPELLDVLKKTFPAYADDLSTESSLKADYRAPYETSSMGLITRGEETWLLFNKRSRRYFFYENSQPDPKICEPKQKAVPAEPW